VNIGNEAERKQSSIARACARAALSDDPRRRLYGKDLEKHAVDARVTKRSMRIVAQPARGRWKTTVIKIAKFPRMSTFKDDSLPQVINYCRLTSINVNCRFASAMRIVCAVSRKTQS